jgi:hypothetical protein
MHQTVQQLDTHISADDSQREASGGSREVEDWLDYEPERSKTTRWIEEDSVSGADCRRSGSKTAGGAQRVRNSRSEWNPTVPPGGNLPFFRRLPFVRGKGFTPFNRVEFNE